MSAIQVQDELKAALLLYSPETSISFASSPIDTTNAFRLVSTSPSSFSLSKGSQSLLQFDVANGTAATATVVRQRHQFGNSTAATPRATLVNTSVTLAVPNIWLYDASPQSQFLMSRVTTSTGDGGPTIFAGQSVAVSQS